MRIALTVLACVALLATPTQSSAGAFGIEMGMSLKELGAGWEEISQPGLYKSTSAPKAHSKIEYYVVRLTPSAGVCYVKGVGQTITTNSFGTQIRSAFGGFKDALEKNYGPNDYTDWLIPGSIWNEPEDFMMGMLKKERYLLAMWRKDYDSILTDDLKYVGLMAHALSRDSAFVSIEYGFVNEEACEAELSKSDDDAL